MLFTISPVVPHLDIVIVKCHGLLPNIDISSGSECERLCSDIHQMSTILPSGAERTTYCLKSTKPEATSTWIAENIKKKTSPPPWTHTSMFPEPTGPQRMSYLLPFTQSSHTLENQYSYIRMLLVDFTSAFNTTSHM